MSLTPPGKVRKLQAALHAKAKGSPTYRFYALYDKVYRPDILSHAYACCKANGGAAGVDGQGFDDIEAYGVDRWLGELAGAVDSHARQRLRRWLCRKHKKRGRGTSHYPDSYLYEALGLVCLPVLTRSFPWAKA